MFVRNMDQNEIHAYISLVHLNGKKGLLNLKLKIHGKEKIA